MFELASSDEKHDNKRASNSIILLIQMTLYGQLIVKDLVYLKTRCVALIENYSSHPQSIAGAVSRPQAFLPCFNFLHTLLPKGTDGSIPPFAGPNNNRVSSTN